MQYDCDTELTEDDEMDNDFIDPRRTRLKVKKLANERSRFSKNLLLEEMKDLPTAMQREQKLRFKFKRFYK